LRQRRLALEQKVGDGMPQLPFAIRRLRVALSIEGEQARARDAGRNLAPELERHGAVALDMDDQRRRHDLRQQRRHVDLSRGLEQRRRGLGVR
jgi:hypothetical protein